jgi:hypothetical protein
MQADTAQRRLLTVREAATELHVSRDWAYANVPRRGVRKMYAPATVKRLRQSAPGA